ncbi:MAG TPA: hypothetical protein VF139_18800 [Candidatus Polarisedimenticolaceae bacterium]
MGAFGGFEVLVLLLVAVPVAWFYLWTCWRVVKRLGFPGSLALLALTGPFVLILVLAFVEWPIERERRPVHGDR